MLLLGETGSGKEVIANAIHYSSPRRNGPFIKVNCGAIPDTLIDSELFGHEKGAFTGALFQKRGRFERAHKGTILLDEIGELPQEAQVRLLRVIQNQEIERVGGTEPISIDIRIIACTHRNLEKMVLLDIPLKSATISGTNRPPVPELIGHLIGAKRRWFFSISQFCFF